MDVKHFTEGFESYSYSNYENYTSREESVMSKSSKSTISPNTLKIHNKDENVSKRKDIEKIITNIKNIYI